MPGYLIDQLKYLIIAIVALDFTYIYTKTRGCINHNAYLQKAELFESHVQEMESTKKIFDLSYVAFSDINDYQTRLEKFEPLWILSEKPQYLANLAQKIDWKFCHKPIFQ